VQTKLASKGQLTAGIAHEIKNPLNFVNNFSSVSVELIDELLRLHQEHCRGLRHCSIAVFLGMWYYVHNQLHEKAMASTTFTLSVETEVKKRLEKLAKSTGRSRSFLAAEALSEYLDVNEWQVAGVRKAMGSLDRGEGVPNEQVKAWVNSSGDKRERPAPKRSAT
jgi:RHH-type rel operon transcriptional repressor/antitoxin RelB